MRKSHEGGKRKTSTRTTEPRVGIFWLVDGTPLIDSTSFSEAEPYGDHLTHPRGHPEVWEQYQRGGLVSREMEYEEAPRGRVMYNTKTLQFTFLADRCILKKRELVEKIKSNMGLPKDTNFSSDSHYRCFVCLKRGTD